MEFTCFFFCLCYITWGVDGANILFVAPVPEYSHFKTVFRLAKELATRGDNVTVISPFPLKEPIPNYRSIFLERMKELIDQQKGNRWKHSVIRETFLYLNLGITLTEETLTHPSVQKLLHSNETFDLVIVQYFFNYGLLGIGHHLNAPVISMCAFYPATYNFYFANPNSLSFIPVSVVSYKHPMNFWERLNNWLTLFSYTAIKQIFYMPSHHKIFKKYLKHELELNQILHNTSLALLNTHVSLRYAGPLVPNIIEIGGFHIDPSEKLPNDLQIFLDSADEGVILFSMGTNLKSKDFDTKTRQIFFEAFSKIKQRVLWKFESDLSGLPSNVKIVNWLPQQAVLAHPNVVAFISHGGHLSAIESIYFGKPFIGIPVYGDQRQNVAYAVNYGYAIKLSLSEITSNSLYQALDEIVTNPKYRQNAQKRSQLLRDRPMEPLDWAIYWVQYVIRHKGAPHLRSPGADLALYQREMVDVGLFVVIMLILILALTITATICLLKVICKRKKIKTN